MIWYIIYAIGFIYTYKRMSNFAKTFHLEYDWLTVTACFLFGCVWPIALPMDLLVASDLRLPKPPKWL
jgi:hypothetical protein